MFTPQFSLMTLVILMFLSMSIMTAANKPKYNMEKKTQFECGFNKMSKNSSSFSNKFFLVMILFLIFDLEIAMLLPASMMNMNSKISSIPPIMFILIITIGMLIEWKNGMIEWTS